MKNIQNITLTFKDQVGEQITKTYAQMIRESVNAVSPQGVTIDEMRKRMRIMDEIDKIPTDSTSEYMMEFTQPEIDIIKEQVGQIRWMLISSEIITFSEFVNAL